MTEVSVNTFMISFVRWPPRAMQDVEGADDRLARVTCFLQGRLVSSEERLEPLAAGVVAERFQFRMGERHER